MQKTVVHKQLINGLNNRPAKTTFYLVTEMSIPKN